MLKVKRVKDVIGVMLGYAESFAVLVMVVSQYSVGVMVRKLV
jgi:hypothetical protein